MKSQISLKLRPNNQITLSVGTWRKKELPVSQSIQNDFDKITIEQWQERKDEIIGDRLFYERQSQNRKSRTHPKLDIIKKFQRSKKNPACKLPRPKSFTNKSGQKLRECGGAIDIMYGGETRFCHEITLTLPANTPQAIKALSAYSGYAMNRIFEPLRKKYGEMLAWFYVWEYQKRGAPHTHICIAHPDEAEGQYIAAQIIEQWHRILIDIGDRANCCMFAAKRGDRCTIRSKHQHHTAPIKKAVGAYFSKYAGKEYSKNDWYCQKYPVSRFWGSNSPIKKIVKENSLSFDFDYQGNEDEAEKKLQSIIENIIEKLSIVSTSSYEFAIKLAREHRLNIYKNGRKILSQWEGKCIAIGERFTFYFEQSELKTAIALINLECQYF